MSPVVKDVETGKWDSVELGETPRPGKRLISVDHLAEVGAADTSGGKYLAIRRREPVVHRTGKGAWEEDDDGDEEGPSTEDIERATEHFGEGQEEGQGEGQEDPVEGEYVDQLEEMGFSRERARKALIKELGDFQAAVDWLLSAGEEEQARALTRAEVRAAREAVGGSRRRGSEFSRQRGAAHEALVSRLSEMGFSQADADRAVSLVGPDPEAATSYLLRERTQ